METVTVSTKFQVVIPRSIREIMSIRPGDKIVMIERDKVIHLVRLQEITNLRGKFKKLTTKGLRDKGERF